MIAFDANPNASCVKPGPRPWQSCVAPPHVDELKSHARPSYGFPGDSQNAPSVFGVVSPTFAARRQSE
jgi:hypothetical protein